MRLQLQNYLQANRLLTPADKVLLAVSGGIDSMVMAHLFLSLGYPIGVAHCNFSLRGAESDADQELVRSFAEQHRLASHFVCFDTAEYADSKGISIQMAARDLRYAWFKELEEQHQYTCVAVAHHADDAIETFFINLLRGTGLQGLTGMRPRHGTIIRPLLFASRKDIEAYADKQSVTFREDASNSQEKYARNKLRHVVLPAMESINPVFRQRMAVNMQYLAQTQAFMEVEMKKMAAKVSELRGNDLYISIEALRQQSSPELCLFHLLEPYGFKGSLLTDILASLDASSGKTFYSGMYKLLKDRAYLVVLPLSEGDARSFLLYKTTLYITTPIALAFSYFQRTADFVPQKSPFVVQLDADRLVFPLCLRPWQAGDRFVPFGMKGQKKLSDFFVDQKLTLADKQRQWVLLSGDEIVWVVGRRMDDRFRVSEHTREVLQISFEP